MPERITVEVAGRRLALSNLDKVLYPEHGFTKAEVIDFYTRVAPYMLPHVVDRPATRKRYPDGVDGGFFYEKNAPSHTPRWVRTVTLPVPGSTMDREVIDFILIEDLPTLVWLANLAALELHVPQWTVADTRADLVVFDLDPGPPATIVECTEVALMLRELLARDGLTGFPKTSGAKGMQVYAPISAADAHQTSAYARGLARRLARAHPDLIVFQMTKSLRRGKVFVDWSQNNAAKTTVAPYSLRATPLPTVSTPVTWDEVATCESPDDLRFLATDVLDRVAMHGDLLAALTEPDRPALPASGDSPDETDG